MAFLAGIGIALKEARRVGEDPNKVLDLAFYMLIASILGSRILYVLVNWSMFRDNLLDIFRIWHGGLIFYGGFIGAVVTALWYVRRKELHPWKTADILAPSIAFGQFVGRIGCFFAGCCYGKVCDLPWALTFTHPDSLAPKGVPLHPTQIYSALNALLIFFVLVAFKRIKRFEGELFWIYVLLYGVARFIIEHFRGDERGMFIEDLLSTSQLIGLIMAAIAVVMLLILRRRHA
jgi:phosphatidylglycerol:prolipoprotein diacylglycerol transferase